MFGKNSAKLWRKLKTNGKNSNGTVYDTELMAFNEGEISFVHIVYVAIT